MNSAEWDEQLAIQEYARLMEAGPLPENEEALQTLLEQAYARGLYFEYNRDTQSYYLVGSTTRRQA